MENLKLHETINFYRRKQNLTQEALAQRLGVTNQSVSKWESAQCYPDISLLPQLAEIFEISIDELFGKEPKSSVLKDVFSLRDDVLRIVVVRGDKIVEVKDIDKPIQIEFPRNQSGDRQILRAEIFGSIVSTKGIFGEIECHGNIECDTISGDASCHGNLECNQINGDTTIFYGTLSCNGDIHGNARTFNTGDISCSNIVGNVNCGGSVECEKIEGDVQCQGNIIYK